MYAYESRLLGKLKMKQDYLFGCWYYRYIFLIILVFIIFTLLNLLEKTIICFFYKTELMTHTLIPQITIKKENVYSKLFTAVLCIKKIIPGLCLFPNNRVNRYIN